MNRTIAIVAAAAALFLAGRAPTVAAARNAAEMTKLQYLVGSWDCSWTAGQASGAVRLRFENTFDGTWIAEHEFVVKGDAVPNLRSIHYTAYDVNAKKYVHVGPNADGTFDVAESPDAEHWRSAMPSRGETLTFRKISDSSFSESAPMSHNGQQLTFVQTCTKT